jgi:hypothetical protein
MPDPDPTIRKAMRRSKRWLPRALVAAAFVLTAAGGFLLWGPVGLGNGPLSMASGGASGAADPGAGPYAILLPVHNSDHDQAVIDSVQLIGGTQYPAPHLLSLNLVGSHACGAAFSAQSSAASGYAVRDCGTREDSPLVGHAIGFTSVTSFGYAAAAQVSAPARGTCVVMTKIVVHYHVGIRHYTATDPNGLALCWHYASSSALQVAISAAMTAIRAN